MPKLGRYLTLNEFCTCTQTYQKYADQIQPFPKNPDETIPALELLCQHVVDPIIDRFGRGRFQLTYGFCSADLKRWLAKKDPITGMKNGRVSPNLDQHMAHEVNRNGKYYCSRLGAACDFRIVDLPSNELATWILAQELPFDSLYFYGPDRPIHISYGPQHKRDIWAFTETGTPIRSELTAGATAASSAQDESYRFCESELLIGAGEQGGRGATVAGLSVIFAVVAGDAMPPPSIQDWCKSR